MDRSLTIVREQLVACRRRGLPFIAAWPLSLDVGLAVASDDELPDTFEALTGTWAAWLVAYERRPSRLAELAKAPL